MIVKNRIAGTRITIWDVLHYLEAGWSRPDIAATLHLTEVQVAAAARYIEEHRDEVMVVHRQNESPRSKLRGIKPPLAYSCGPPVWRGGGRRLLGMCCLRTLEQPQLDVLAMQLRIAFVTALCRTYARMTESFP